MLVLTRRVGESFTLTIGDKTIVVKLEAIKSKGRAVFCFEAPRDVVIKRSELLTQPAREGGANP